MVNSLRPFFVCSCVLWCIEVGSVYVFFVMYGLMLYGLRVVVCCLMRVCSCVFRCVLCVSFVMHCVLLRELL